MTTRKRPCISYKDSSDSDSFSNTAVKRESKAKKSKTLRAFKQADPLQLTNESKLQLTPFKPSIENSQTAALVELSFSQKDLELPPMDDSEDEFFSSLRSQTPPTIDPISSSQKRDAGTLSNSPLAKPSSAKSAKSAGSHKRVSTGSRKSRSSVKLRPEAMEIPKTTLSSESALSSDAESEGGDKAGSSRKSQSRLVGHVFRKFEEVLVYYSRNKFFYPARVVGFNDLTNKFVVQFPGSDTSSYAQKDIVRDYEPRFCTVDVAPEYTQFLKDEDEAKEAEDLLERTLLTSSFTLEVDTLSLQLKAFLSSPSTIDDISTFIEYASAQGKRKIQIQGTLARRIKFWRLDATEKASLTDCLYTKHRPDIVSALKLLSLDPSGLLLGEFVEFVVKPFCVILLAASRLNVDFEKARSTVIEDAGVPWFESMLLERNLGL